MTEFRSEFLKTVAARDYIHQCTDEAGLDAALAEGGPKTCYIGFDCTADSLHVGSLIQIMLLRRWQQSGHKPIVLMGGGTTKVGDPSGKDESRQLLDDSRINRNMESIKGIFSRFLTFGDNPTDAVMINNADWLDTLQYIPFLRDYGRHFSVNRMLGFESVKIRLDRDQPLSFLEFNYMILQAYDFLELHRRNGCIVQIGGSDQWGNIVNGIELVRRVDSTGLYGLTSPLITTASGEKMGKTAGGAVWLNAERLGAYAYFQFWRNTEDGDVGRFLKLFTELALDEIDELERGDINQAKKKLALEATRLCHGEMAADEAAETARLTFEEKKSAAGLPRFEIARAELESGIPAFELLLSAGLVASKGEARRLIRGGGARVNDVAFSDETQSVTVSDVAEDGVIKLSVGKKRHVLVLPV